MESSLKYPFFLAFLIVLSFAAVDGAGECAKSSPDSEAWKLLPCASAAPDANAQVSDRCCQQVKRIGQNPSCLCAVMLSNTAKSAGVKPEIALTIPKRCNIEDRPVGYKCGAYTLPSFKNLSVLRSDEFHRYGRLLNEYLWVLQLPRLSLQCTRHL